MHGQGTQAGALCRYGNLDNCEDGHVSFEVHLDRHDWVLPSYRGLLLPGLQFTAEHCIILDASCA